MFRDKLELIQRGALQVEDLYSSYECRFDSLRNKGRKLLVKSEKVIEYCKLDTSAFNLTFHNVKSDGSVCDFISFDTESKRFVVSPKCGVEGKCRVMFFDYVAETDEVLEYENWRSFQRVLHDSGDMQTKIREFLVV